MKMIAVLSWMVCGLLVGLAARILVPARLEVGLVWAMMLSMVGAVVGGLLNAAVQGMPSEPYSLAGHAWHGWIAAIFGGVIVLFAWGGVYPKRWWS